VVSDGRTGVLRATLLAALLVVSACSGKKKGTPVLDLAKDGPGTCLEVPDTLGEQVKRLPVVDCSTSHSHEIYSVEKWDKGDVFPGNEALDTFAQQRCVASFRRYVGVSNFDSALTFTWLTPTLDSWNNHKDRNVLCVLQNADAAPMTTSMKDSHR
jgi:hypothetical protein